MMRLKVLLLCFCGLLFLSVNAGNENKYKLSFHVKGWENKVCYFGFYYGENPYIGLDKNKKKDSVIVDAKGNFVFSADSLLPAGVYFIITQDNKQRIEYLVDKEQQFFISTDTADVIGLAKVKGSEENTLFYGYQKYLADKHKELEKYKTDKNKGMVDSVDHQMKKYSEDLVSKHPEMLLSKLLLASKDPEVPPSPKLANGRVDSTFPFRYYKAHYFDNVDLSDGRLVRSPVLFPKIKFYLEKMTMPVPDSINVAADYLVAKTKGSKEMFRFIVSYITDKYERSDIMGMDAVFVHMAKEYYTPDKAYWVSASQLEKIKEKQTQVEPILLGKHAPPLALPDTNNVIQALDSIRADYTVVYFWDYDCSHCQKETPILLKWYETVKDQGIQVYAVEQNEKDLTKWKEYIRKNKLDWINVSDIFGTGNFRYQYDVITTPTIFVVDENKNIVAKKINAEDLDKVIKHDKEKRSGTK